MGNSADLLLATQLYCSATFFLLSLPDFTVIPFFFFFFFYGSSTSTNSTSGIRQHSIYLFFKFMDTYLKKFLVYNSKRELEFWSFFSPFILIFPLIFCLPCSFGPVHCDTNRWDIGIDLFPCFWNTVPQNSMYQANPFYPQHSVRWRERMSEKWDRRLLFYAVWWFLRDSDTRR